MSNLLGFFSYVHDDDENDGGRIVQLGRDIVSELKAISGDDELELFLDRENLHIGDHWRPKVDDALSNVSFFIPILTPRFFRRAECRRELQFFMDQAKLLGISEIIMPVLYIDTPELHDSTSSDSLIKLLQGVQWESWTEVRAEGRSSSTYRKGIERLGQELDRRRKLVESTDIIPAATEFEKRVNLKFEEKSQPLVKISKTDASLISPDIEGDEVGTLEILGAMEDAFPRITQTLSDISVEIGIFNEIITNATNEFQHGNREGKGFAWRLQIARHVAIKITEPIDRIEDLGRKYLSDLHEIDTGFRVLLPKIVEESNEDLEALHSTKLYFQSVREMYVSSKSSKDSILAMVDSFKPIENLSKDLRPPLRKMRSTFVSMSEAQVVIQEWMSMIETTGIEYSEIAELEN